LKATSRDQAIILVVGSLILLISFIDLHTGVDESLFSFDRQKILVDGEIWRIFTGHFSHLDYAHLAGSMVSLIAIIKIFSPYVSTQLWATAVVGGSIWVSSCFLLLKPSLGSYAGFSGVLYGALVLGLARAWLVTKKRTWLIFSFLLFLKLGYEQIFGPLPYANSVSKFHVVVDAHLYGAIFGMVVMVITVIRRKNKVIRSR